METQVNAAESSPRGTWMGLYALASLLPAVLIGAACVMGGTMAYVAATYVTLLVYGVDRTVPMRLRRRWDGGAERAAHWLSLGLGAAHFALLALGVRALSGGVPLNAAEWAALFIALGVFFGQISNSNAHELIHGTDRLRRGLGTAIYCSLLFGHHVSAHLRVHHIWVATARDPNSARLGEGFYRFWPRAWIGSFLAGLAAENALRARGTRSRWAHPYLIYGLGAGVTLAAAGLLAGPKGVLALLALAIYAQMQLLISDYVQHYGLRRTIGPDGRAEAVGPQHAWNAVPWLSGAMMLNAPRHSDHHIHPARPFPALTLRPKTMPLLPATFPLMGLIATIPPLWRRVMDPKVAQIYQEFSKTGADAGDLAGLPHDTVFDDSPPCSGDGEPAQPVAGGYGRGGV